MKEQTEQQSAEVDHDDEKKERMKTYHVGQQFESLQNNQMGLCFKNIETGYLFDAARENKNVSSITEKEFKRLCGKNEKMFAQLKKKIKRKTERKIKLKAKSSHEFGASDESRERR